MNNGLNACHVRRNSQVVELVRIKLDAYREMQKARESVKRLESVQNNLETLQNSRDPRRVSRRAAMGTRAKTLAMSTKFLGKVSS